MSDSVMLSTVNNPFNPFTDFDNWLNYDYKNGYDTCGRIARIAQCSNALSDELNDEEIEMAMDTIVESMPHLFIKLHKSNAADTIKRMQLQSDSKAMSA